MFELVRKNQRRSVLLTIMMAIVLVSVGFAGGELSAPGAGWVAAIGAFVLFWVLFLLAYRKGGHALLTMAGARRVEADEAKQLHNIVDEMVIASGLARKPEVYVLDTAAMNAFATGCREEDCAVAVTDGLLGALSRDELQAVIAHEVAHIKNRDVLFMTMLSVMAGAIAIVSDFFLRRTIWMGRAARGSRLGGRRSAKGGALVILIGLLLIVLGRLCAQLIYFAASRTREFMADAGSAIFTRNPGALASALEKIHEGARLEGFPSSARGMLIVGPALFATHPPVEQRIAILQSLAGQRRVSYGRYAVVYQDVTKRRARFVPPAARALASTPLAVAAPKPTTTRALRREAEDAVRKQHGYKMVACTCGAKLKIPATLPASQHIACLACGAEVKRP